MKLGYNQACGMNCSTLEQDLLLCDQAGFDYIEIRLDMLSRYLRTHTLEDLKGFFSTHHLKPHALNAIYLYDQYLGDDDDLPRAQQLTERFFFACMAAKEIGAPAVIVVPPLQPDPAGGPYVGDWEDTKANCIRMLSQLSKWAAPFGIDLCFELVGFTRSSVRSMAQARELVEAVDCANVGYVMDSYNIYLYNQCNDFTPLLDFPVEKIFAVHINNAEPATPEEMGQHCRTFVDDGVVDLPHYLDCLQQLGYTGMVSIETFRPEYWNQSPQWVVEQGYKTTKALLAQQGCLDE